MVTADGFSGTGVRDAQGNVVGSASLTAIPGTQQYVVSVPKEALGGIDLASAGYALTMMSHAGDDEGAGGIRPVYDLAYWESTAGTDKTWIHEYRFGGGAGEWTDTNAARDTDTSDANVLDYRTASPVVLPYVALAQP